MQPKLSILIPTLESRGTFYLRLMNQINFQLNMISVGANKVVYHIGRTAGNIDGWVETWDGGGIELLRYKDKGELTTGAKRNALIEAASGEVCSFVDDDDLIADCYIQKGIEFANSKMDVASLVGLYFLNGVYDRPFVHSNQYTHWYTAPDKYIRNNNHLNYIRTDIARQIKYPDQTVGEDGKWSEALKASGLIKTEYEIKEVLYFYFARSKKDGE